MILPENREKNSYQPKHFCKCKKLANKVYSFSYLYCVPSTMPVTLIAKIACILDLKKEKKKKKICILPKQVSKENT